MRTLVSILLILFFASEVLRTFVRCKVIIAGNKIIKNTKSQYENLIKLRNLQDSKNRLQISVVLCILTCLLVGVVGGVFIINLKDILLAIALILLLISTVLNIFTSLIAYCNIEECYITPEGIVAYDGAYNWGDCKFTIEVGLASKISNTKSYGKNINVYRNNINIPFRFKIIDNDEEVIRLINNFNLPKDMIERVSLMEQYMDEVADYISDGAELDSDIRNKIDMLSIYCDGGLWLHDYECDEKGEVPADLKRGVLSQDSLYDLLDRCNKLEIS